MEFAEECMRLLWHRGMGGQFDHLDSPEYTANADRALRLTFKYNPVMLGLYKLFPDLF